MTLISVALLFTVASALSPSGFLREIIKPGSPESRQQPMEPHHSLHHPFDQSVVYWKFGGSTVMTKNLIRLVPAAQSRSGWLWNDYPLESEDWEVETRRMRFL